MLKLVYACLAFSAVAFVALIVASADRGPAFRGTTAGMARALTEAARVLDADTKGAIVQTGNGRVEGYRRGQEDPVWSFEFERFPDNPDGGWSAEPPNAAAWCAGACPAAITSAEGSYSAHGGASAALASRLNAGGQRTAELLDVLDTSSALANLAGDDSDSSQLAFVSGSTSERLPVQNASVAIASKSGTRVIAGTSLGNAGRLTRAIRDDGRWRTASPTIDEPNLANMCLSSDGRWVGAVSRRVLLLPFVGDAGFGAGNPVSSGLCRADASGYTVAVNPLDRPNFVAASRYTHDGRRIWARTFGSVRLLSPTGSPRVVVQDREQNLTAIDAISGKVVLKRHVDTKPFVGADGAIVTASRAGTPLWIVAEPGSVQ